MQRKLIEGVIFMSSKKANPKTSPNTFPSVRRTTKSKNTPTHPNPDKHTKLYHNPLTLLKSYRAVRLSLHLSMEQHQQDFEAEYGMTITEYLNDIYAAGIEFTGTKLEHHANTMKRTAEMLRLVDKSVHLIKEHDGNGGEGEYYYWILYYTFLSPIKLDNAEEIIKAVKAHFPCMTRDNYFDRRKRALNMFAQVLWGFERCGL